MDATQALEPELRPIETRSTPREATLSIELVAYIALAFLALVLRIAQLDVVPMTANESRQALAAWRVVYPEAAGSLITPESPLLFAVHTLSFSVFGASEISARLFTVIASIGLVLMPLLFRDLFGQARTFMFSLLLTFSPVVLITSRADSPVIWTMLIAAVGLWAFRSYGQTKRMRYAVGATVCLAVVLLLTDPTGPVFVLSLVLAALFAYWLQLRDAQAGIETPESSAPASSWSAWPWAAGLPIAALVVFLVGTLFVLYPSGLSGIGELLNATVRGLTTPRPYVPGAFPTLVTLFYEPFLVALGVGAVVWLINQDRFSTANRFLLGMAVFGIALSAIYAGSGAEQALWIVVPLAGLGSAVAADLLSRPADSLWWRAPEWSRWLLLIVMIALLAMFSVHAQSLGRTLLNVPDTLDLTTLSNSISVVWVIIIILFVIIGYFLAAGVWGIGMTTRGGLLGVMAFALVTSLGGGWRVAVYNADDPVELWNRQATSSDTILLRNTLLELAKRETSGFPEVQVSVLAPDDGVVAWLLRDFPNTTFIPDANAAKLVGVVLLPSVIEQPDLGGPYVGERFGITNTWNMGSVRLLDFPAWWLQRRTRTGGVPSDEMVLWLRQDVYNGVPQPGQ